MMFKLIFVVNNNELEIPLLTNMYVKGDAGVSLWTYILIDTRKKADD